MRVDIVTELLPVRPGLGRHVEHDPRSRRFDVAAAPAAGGTSIVPVTWARHSRILDQGALGSCTGQAMAGWLACEPHCTSDEVGGRWDGPAALALYEAATRLDPFPGQYPPDDTGSSGNAAAKAARALGLIRSWSWAFSTTGLLRALMVGPVIVGVPWFRGMFDPDGRGVVSVSGPVDGGHEFLVRGWTGEFLLCDNSWSERWGPLGGSFLIAPATWEILRRHRADVTVPHV